MGKFYLDSFVRKNIKTLSLYTGLREKYFDKNAQFFDANESPFGEWSRYPDSFQKDLKRAIADKIHLKYNRIFLGNGSEELIDILIRVFCEPNKDAIVVMNPTYAMYEYYAVLNDVEVLKINLDDQFNLPKKDFDKICKNHHVKILFLCCPNNPTGNCVEDIAYFINHFPGLVVVDEAYQSFSSKSSCIELLEKYENLIVLRTLSKAYGMAGLRIGIGISSPEISELMSNVKPPYTISSIAKQKAVEELQNMERITENIDYILKEREIMLQEMASINCVEKIYPTEANFFLIKFDNAPKVYEKLLKNNIITSIKHPEIEHCIRINIGKKEDNKNLIEILKGVNFDH